MKLINSLFKLFQNLKFRMRHYKKPYKASKEHEAIIEAKRKEIMASAYYQSILPLKEKVVGKIVSKSMAGTSGFVLFFSEGDWVVSFLQDMELHWKMGEGEIAQDLEALINSPQYGDGFRPLPVDRPYASQVCNISKEIANSHGKKIIGLSFGARCFNFGFPGGKELNATIVPTDENKNALRVFWEQW